MEDLTVIFLTINKVPKAWAAYQLEVLKEAVGKAPVISVSREAMDFGTNIQQVAPFSASNIYLQMLRAARLADTPYIAIAEDDVLYPLEHFHSYRPPLDAFAYNLVRWQLHTWGEPTFYWRVKLANYAMIAPRQLTIEALEERFARWPDGMPEGRLGELGRYTVERRLKVSLRQSVQFQTTIGLVCLHHDYGLDPLERNHRKRRGMLRATEIPYWGRAEEIVRRFV